MQSADSLCRHFQHSPVIEKRCFREWFFLPQQTFRLPLSQSADGAERIPDKQQSFPGKAIVFFLLLFVFAGIQMLSGRAGLLFHAALNGKAAALQMERQIALQFFQTLPRINLVGIQASFLCHGHMKKVHVRRFFIHVHHRGNDIFRPPQNP